MSVMEKVYVLLYIVCAVVCAAGSGYIFVKKRREVQHDCRSCSHCVLIDKGADGKLIYTCGIDRNDEPKILYEHAIPVYCGWWKGMDGKPVSSAYQDKYEQLVRSLQVEVAFYQAERKKREKNSRRLTVPELKKMEGEPVYLKSKGEDFEDGWQIISSVNRTTARFQPAYKMLEFENYGNSWEAYRYEQEEGR